MPFRSLLAAAILACLTVGMATATPCLAQVRALPPNVAASDYAPASVPGRAGRPEVSLASRMFDVGPIPPMDELPATTALGPTVDAEFEVWQPAAGDSWCVPPTDSTWGHSGLGGSSYDGPSYGDPSTRTHYLQVLPDGLMFPAYLAGQRESRMASQWVYLKDRGWMWDVTLGGRAGILRFGTDDPMFPEGWQIDIEGAAFPRMNYETGREMESTDFRFGVPWTTRRGPWEYKFGYYHLSSHLGDEFMVTNNTFDRINYVRDSLVLGVATRPHPDFRIYGEVGWAFYTNGGAEPFEFQFGVDYGSTRPTGVWGSPFAAINGHLREEVDFGGHLSLQAGWQWRGPSGHLFRTGMQYFTGKSIQYQFFDRHEDQIGMALWYDY